MLPQITPNQELQEPKVSHFWLLALTKDLLYYTGIIISNESFSLHDTLENETLTVVQLVDSTKILR